MPVGQPVGTVEHQGCSLRRPPDSITNGAEPTAHPLRNQPSGAKVFPQHRSSRVNLEAYGDGGHTTQDQTDDQEKHPG